MTYQPPITCPHCGATDCPGTRTLAALHRNRQRLIDWWTARTIPPYPMP